MPGFLPTGRSGGDDPDGGFVEKSHRKKLSAVRGFDGGDDFQQLHDDKKK